MLSKKNIFFLLLLLAPVSPCFSQALAETLTVSEEVIDRGGAIRNDLYFLYDLDNPGEGKRHLKKESTANENNPPVMKFEETEEDLIRRSLQAERQEEERDLREASEVEKEKEQRRILEKKRGSDEVIKKWKDVFHSRNTSYVISLFENDKKLLKWLGRSPEPLFFAISAKNLDMVEFISEKGGIDWARGTVRFSPEQFSIIVQDLRIMDFFLNHPEANFDRRNVWGEHLFHVVHYGNYDSVPPKNEGFEIIVQ